MKKMEKNFTGVGKSGAASVAALQRGVSGWWGKQSNAEEGKSQAKHRAG